MSKNHVQGNSIENLGCLWVACLCLAFNDDHQGFRQGAENPP